MLGLLIYTFRCSKKKALGIPTGRKDSPKSLKLVLVKSDSKCQNRCLVRVPSSYMGSELCPKLSPLGKCDQVCLHVIAELGSRHYRPSNACYGHRSNSTATTGCSKGGHRILRRPPTASFRCEVFQNAPTVVANCHVDPQNLCSKHSLPLKFRF